MARLAYNKGTALFRGNDPLQRRAAATFLVINTLLTDIQHASHGSDRNGEGNAGPLLYACQLSEGVSLSDKCLHAPQISRLPVGTYQDVRKSSKKDGPEPKKFGVWKR